MPVIQQKDYLADLTDEVLRDLARNDAASSYMRKEATRLLMARNSAYAKHEDLRRFAEDLEAEADAHKEVVAIVESAIEGEIWEPASREENPALTASYTTRNS